MDDFKLAQEKGIGGVGVKGFMPFNSTKDGKIKVPVFNTRMIKRRP